MLFIPAVPSTTAVITVADFPEVHRDAVLSPLRETAAAVGVTITTLPPTQAGGNRDFRNCKITPVLRYLQNDVSASHVMWVDASDTLWQLPLAAACDAYNHYRHPILVSGATGPTPGNPNEKMYRNYPEAGASLRYVNTGVWFGERYELLRLFLWLHGVAGEAKTKEAADDQWLWHAAYTSRGEFPIAVDAYARMSCSVQRLVPDAAIDLSVPGVIRWRETNTVAPIVHVSGQGRTTAWLGVRHRRLYKHIMTGRKPLEQFSKQLVGTVWRQAGSGQITVTLLADGVLKSSHLSGTGTWTVVDAKTVKMSPFSSRAAITYTFKNDHQLDSGEGPDGQFTKN